MYELIKNKKCPSISTKNNDGGVFWTFYHDDKTEIMMDWETQWLAMGIKTEMETNTQLESTMIIHQFGNFLLFLYSSASDSGNTTATENIDKTLFVTNLVTPKIKTNKHKEQEEDGNMRPKTTSEMHNSKHLKKGPYSFIHIKKNTIVHA